MTLGRDTIFLDNLFDDQPKVVVTMFAVLSNLCSGAIKRRAVQSALLLLGVTVLQLPASAAGQLYLTEDEVAERSDWVMVVDAMRLPDYLRYPGSKLNPITQVRISYLNCLEKIPARPVLYEDFWYHDGQPIGCRRYSLMTIKPVDRRGTIFVKCGKDISANTAAVANAIVRLTVDLNVHDVSAAAVIVPEELHRQLVSDFGGFGFIKRAVQSGAQVTIRLVSNPRVFDEYLYYKVTN